MLIDVFNNELDVWIDALQHYSTKELYRQPAENSWSIGQVYVHLINDTNFYIEPVKASILNNKNSDEQMTSFAQTMFVNNTFPNEKLSNPFNANMPQP